MVAPPKVLSPSPQRRGIYRTQEGAQIALCSLFRPRSPRPYALNILRILWPTCGPQSGKADLTQNRILSARGFFIDSTCAVPELSSPMSSLSLRTRSARRFRAVLDGPEQFLKLLLLLETGGSPDREHALDTLFDGLILRTRALGRALHESTSPTLGTPSVIGAIRTKNNS